MKSIFIAFFLILCMLALNNAAAEERASVAAEPLYKTLYEEGFYDEAISMIKDSLLHDTSNAKKLLIYMASCYIASNKREAGAAVFDRLLKADPYFQLDTLLTPPKIIKVFKAVKSQYKAKADTSHIINLISMSYKSLTSDSNVNSFHSNTKDMKIDQRLLKPLQISLGLLPGGAGQFYHKEHLKGLALLTVQATAASIFIWSGWKKNKHYESGLQGHGWYEGNKAINERYTNYARIGFCIFIGSYAYSVTDYFFKFKEY